MDFQFPQQLFPSFYNSGPPDSVVRHFAGDWGSYQRVLLQGGSGSDPTWTFIPKHEVRGETWRHTEPIPVPLLSPKDAFLPYVTPPDPLSFTEHMQNFFEDHKHDAFGCMSNILGGHFFFSDRQRQCRQRCPEGSVNMWRVRKHLDQLHVKKCRQTYYSLSLNRYCCLLSDVVPSVPPDLLGPLLHEELAGQRDRLLFCEAATGGALAFVPFSQSGGGAQQGCLLYPGRGGQDQLNFHKVALQQHPGESPPTVDSSSSKPVSFQLQGPIRQLSAASTLHSGLVGVRLDHLCGVWSFSEQNQPRLLQAVKTSEPATCISLSPHVCGEVLVASESGAAHLWTVGKGMQKVRAEDSNLYFNARSRWRWCEFSAHPRVALYADRTGAELTDVRAGPPSSHTLFRISGSSECRSGERLILVRYLGDAHCFHHLVTTQYSAYVMDERFPGVPMLKMDHQMQSPPVFCHVVPEDGRSTKVLLGSHRSQEVTLLQYSGGRSDACSSRGPPQALLRATDSLKQLPALLPLRQSAAAAHRLSAPATGLTCIGPAAGASERRYLCVLQLTEAGDIFYQVVESERRGAEVEAAAATRRPSLLVEDTSSEDDNVIGPTQAAAGFVPESPDRDCASLSEDSEAESGRRRMKQWKVPVVVNEDPDPDPEPEPDPEPDQTGVEDRSTRRSGEETLRSSPPQDLTPPALSKAAFATWERWLQKLVQRSRRNKPRPLRSQHFIVSTERLLKPVKTAPPGSGGLQEVREYLRSCMSRRSLALSAPGQDPDPVPVPDQVDPEAWADPLSRRLTASWRGEEAWLAWWEEELGTHKEARAQALRRKRRREKEARRAAGQQAELSASFSSSASCLSELDDFSAPGQAAWFDTEWTPRPSRDPAPERDPTETDAPTGPPASEEADPQTPAGTGTGTPDPSPAPERRRKLLATQEDPVQMEDPIPEDPVQEDPTQAEDPVQEDPTQAEDPVPAEGNIQKEKPVQKEAPSTPAARYTSSSQFSSSQNSLGRLSQTSQPKKKKSRMGF